MLDPLSVLHVQWAVAQAEACEGFRRREATAQGASEGWPATALVKVASE